MARTVQECNDYIVSNLVTTFAAVGITITPTLWSQTNFIRLLCYSFAIAQSLAEQLQDVYLAKMQAIQDVSAAASPTWLQDKVFKFQYSSTTPQYLSVIAGVPQYAVVNSALRIVTACSVSVTITGDVLIKVAKGTTTLGALAAGEITALQNYVTQLGAAGINYIVSSPTSDKLYIEGTVYYKGIYSAVIQTTVIDTLNAYLLNLSRERFGGDILISDIRNVMRNIEGVNDVVLERVSARYNSQSLFGGIDLVLAGDEMNRKYTAKAGYLIQETTASNTFSDKLTFVAE